MTPAPLEVVLCWHLHQPDYRLGANWQRPWTWLHAVKDYTDMAAHLERVPGVRAVVNFSPALLDQLQALSAALDSALTGGAAIGDPLLDALAGRRVDDETALQRALLRAHEVTMADRFPPYRRLAARAAEALDAGAVLEPGARDDLLVWYTLCWLGESVRGDRCAVRLSQQSAGFTCEDRRELLALVTECIAGIVPRYRALAEAGTVELSVSPYSHPILPLLLDFSAAREALPGVPLPPGGYPGGAERCDWQITEAIRVFREAFGRMPAGCWPSEGGLSEATLACLGRHGFAWTASGSRVLLNSLGDDRDWPQLTPWQLDGRSGPAVFFRDDALSDRIGFVYSSWSAAEAAADLVRHLEHVRAHAPRGRPAALVIIMDGENAWEYYHQNGWEFLDRLYRGLADHPALRLTTFSDALDRVPSRALPRLVAGSWVHGSFSTWIGDPARNRAWSLLAEAKRAVDDALAESGALIGPDRLRRIERQLAVCEASDWFWWLDEGNPHPDVGAFEELFRAQLVALYRAARQVPPGTLAESLVRERKAPVSEPSVLAESTMRRSGEDGAAQ